MKSIHKYLSKKSITKIQSAIHEAGGNEVFFIGETNANKLVIGIKVLARGDESSVPVIRRKANSGDVLIHNHPSGALKPSTNDMQISHDLSGFGIASYIVNNEVDDIYPITEPFLKSDIKFIDTKNIVHLLESEGAVAHKLPGYEYRIQQLEMVEKICGAFNNDKVAVIEAGTGVGKTLAYLLPAVYWAVKNKERCVVSTNTINLQEQLIKKDIPFLQSVLDVEFKAVLVKGRSNYICLRKVAEIQKEPDLFIESEEKNEIETLINWSKTTSDGSKSDLNFIPKEDTWEKVAADSDTCLRSNCRNFKSCFVTLARRMANQAHILVVNHHLLFSDLAVRSEGMEIAVLPSYTRLIFDEAHHIEDVATQYFGGGVSRIGIDRMLGRLYRIKEGTEKGYLPFLVHKIHKIKQKIENDVLDEVISTIEKDIVKQIDPLANANDQAMDAIFNLIYANAKNEFGEIKQRLTHKFKEYPTWNSVLAENVNELITGIKKLCSDIKKVISKLEGCNISFDDEVYSLFVSIYAQCERLLEAIVVMDDVLFREGDSHVRWIEIKSRATKPITRLKISPLDVAELMNETVYKRFDTIIMTSATLAVSGIKNWNEFDYLANRIGLNLVEKNRLETAILPAPFDYKKQAMIGIPLDIPTPDSTEFSKILEKLILQSITISRGRAFVLFTSYGLLNIIYSRLEQQLSRLGYTSLKQGTMNRHNLLENFKRDTSSVLFATDSFWEGVDVPGEALESVIITKLPFKVPSEPITEARVEAISQRGGDAFMEYSVPQAVIKLKQGFGRLIRNKTDRGSVLILDKRIIQKFYGKVFLASLPESEITTGSQSHIFEKMQAFFDRRD